MRRLIVCVIMILLAANTLGQELQVEKLVKEDTLQVGAPATVMLRITNPFGKKLPIKIQDKNIFGNNGVDIQCLESVLPADKEVMLGYDPVTPFQGGKFTLDSAKITYTNPVTGKEETAFSNELPVDVKDSGNQAQQAQGITTIYQCGGQSIRSTSYSSVGGSNPSSSPNQQGKNRQDSLQQRMQNNQAGQDMQALKQEMQQEQAKAKQLKEEFAKELSRNKEFQKLNQEIQEMGYNLSSMELEPTANTSGTFKMRYQKEGGAHASLQGSMQDGKLQNVSKETEEDKERLQEVLNANRKYQQFRQDLMAEGFKEQAPEFRFGPDNISQVRTPFKRGNETANITAQFEKEKIKKILLEKPKKKHTYWLWLLILLLLFIATTLWIRRYKRTDEAPVPAAPMIRVDFRSQAKKMLERAKELFREGKQKEAYTLTAGAVRYYYIHTLALDKEITNTELIRLLKKKKIKYKKTKECLDLCSLVGFAKYKPNKKDFTKISSIAEEIIG